jgi:hypothetical protein
MDKSTISPEAEERIRDLCSKISVAHSLDVDIQKELCGHMEDKLLGYVSGNETITEDDALILVREHFGDPQTLKTLLRGVHIRQANDTLFRRILAATAAYFVATTVWVALFSFGMFTRYLGRINGATPSRWNGFETAATLASAGLFAYIVWTWHVQIRRGERVWFLRWNYFTIVVLLIGLAWVRQLVPNIIPFGDVLPPNTALTIPQSGLSIIDILSIAIGVTLFAVCYLSYWIVWLWWCDGSPKAPRRFLWAFLSVACLRVFGFPFEQLPLAGLGLVTQSGRIGGDSNSFVFVNGAITSPAIQWFYFFDFSNAASWYSRMIRHTGMFVGLPLCAGIAACLLYLGAKAIQRRRANRINAI